jgi:urea transporter
MILWSLALGVVVPVVRGAVAHIVLSFDLPALTLPFNATAMLFLLSVGGTRVADYGFPAAFPISHVRAWRR